MKSILRALIITNLIAGFCLLVANSALAQSAQLKRINDEATLAPQIVSSVNCPDAQKFSFGSGSAKFAFCISERGNIEDIESPAGFVHNEYGEGYVACGSGITGDYDSGTDFAGWGAPTADQPNGAHKFPLTITRKSTDGKLELNQTFDWDTAQKEITVTMVLKNISAASMTNVKLARYFDADVDTYGFNAYDDIFDADSDSVWGRQAAESGPRHGLLLSALSLGVTHSAVVEKSSDWELTRKTCTPASVPTPAASPDDYIGRLTYSLGTLAANQSKTVIVLYKRF